MSFNEFNATALPVLDLRATAATARKDAAKLTKDANTATDALYADQAAMEAIWATVGNSTNARVAATDAGLDERVAKELLPATSIAPFATWADTVDKGLALKAIHTFGGRGRSQLGKIADEMRTAGADVSAYLVNGDLKATQAAFTGWAARNGGFAPTLKKVENLCKDLFSTVGDAESRATAHAFFESQAARYLDGEEL